MFNVYIQMMRRKNANLKFGIRTENHQWTGKKIQKRAKVPLYTQCMILDLQFLPNSY